MTSALQARDIPLDRRICSIRPGRIDIRPSRGALLGPFLGLLTGLSFLGAIVFFLDDLPALALVALLIPALLITPLSAMAFVYSIAGSNVLIERQKQSGRFQQGVFGLGLGTQELVPFWKIDHIALEDCDLGEVELRSAPAPVELVAWEVVLVKTSGKRLSVGQVIVAQVEELMDEGFSRAMAVAEALAELVEKPLRITAATEESEVSLVQR